MASVTLVINFRRSGVGISNTDVEYAESTSNTSAPTAGWQTTAPKWRKGYYIWTRTHVYYTNGKEKITTPMCLSTAKSIDRIEECYYSSTSSTAITGGEWIKGQAPKWVNGRYIWTKSIIYYSDGTSEETAPICVTGAQGPQGPQGEPGKDGANAIQYYYHVAWCNTPDNSDNSFSTSCSDGDQYAYMGTCVNTAKDDPETFSAYTWVKIQGEQGEPGKDAVNIQLSQISIVHKKSQYAGTYSLKVMVYRGKDPVAAKISGKWLKSVGSDAATEKLSSTETGTAVFIFAIAAGKEVNSDYILSIIVDGITYSRTIPVRTISDGTAGKDGKNGKRMRGPQSWEELGDGYTFYPLNSEESDVFDVVEYDGKFYECNKQHVKDSSVTPHDDYTAYAGKGNWTLSTQYSFVATKVMWSAIGQIDFFGSQSINVYGQNNNSRICLHNGMVEIFGAVNSVVPNIRFGVDSETGYSILSYYDNNGKWLYDIGPNGWDNKNVTKGRLEGFDYLPAHEYLNNIHNYGFTASSQLYELKGFTVDGGEKDMKVAVSKVNLCLFPRFYADDRTELQKHPLQGWEPGFRITAWKKLYQYTAGRKDKLTLADSERNLTAELAKQADGKWFTSREISNGTKLINLAIGKYIRKGTCVKIGKLPMNSADGSVNSLPAYEFSVGVIDGSSTMSSIEICSQICRSYAGIDINNNLNS